MLQQVLTSSLELLINKTLSLNTHSVGLNKLEQKTLTIILSELNFPLSFSVDNSKILVSGLTERADCTINTSINTLQKLKAEQIGRAHV